MYYLLLSVAAILFAAQFLFNQLFQEECGSDGYMALIFNLYVSSAAFVIMLAVSGFKIRLSIFSVMIAVLYSLVCLLYTYVSVKAFSMVNLSVYSIFAMLGGMLLPFLYGIIFRHESLTAIKILCCLLIAASLFLTASKGRNGGFIYYFLVFVLNGMSGVLTAIHQAGKTAVGSVDFMVINKLISVLICLSVWLICFRRSLKISVKAQGYSLVFAVFCGFGNLLTLIAVKHLPASVQYPIITGGVMVVSLFISLIRKEDITRKNVLSTILAFIASALMMIA